MLAAFDNFPALLIWFPLIGGLVAFFIKDEHKVKSWALIASFLTMLLMCVSMVFSGNSYYQLNTRRCYICWPTGH
jgi:NADH:ubiquinone oxidoreductase subunit 4 (subunit M)